MIIERTVLAVLTALCVVPAGWAVPTIVLDPPVAKPPSPSITVTIPKYRLSANERDLVASCLVLEAASQGEFGMRGVMSVIRNRSHAKPELFAPTVLEEKQFSAFNSLTSGRESEAHVIRRARHDRMWPVALRLVDEATRPSWHDPTGGATHYTRLGEHARWTYALARTTIIGRHAFYR